MPIHNIILLCVLGAAIIASIVLAVLLSKDKQKKQLMKGLLAACLVIAVGSTGYLSVAAATGTLMPPKVVTAFDPNMNGYYENIKADNCDIYTGDFVAGYYDGKGKITYKDTSYYDGDWANNVKQSQGTHLF